MSDHLDAILARCEEYQSLDLVGRNSLDDLRSHAKNLAAERDALATYIRYLEAFAGAGTVPDLREEFHVTNLLEGDTTP